MTYCLPVLQYEPDEPASDTRSVDTASQQQPAAPASKQGAVRSSSTRRRPAAKTSSSSSKAGKEPQQELERPDLSHRPDVMQELAKERKRRAFIGMLKLLEHGAQDSSELQLLVAPMSDEELLQVAQERSLAGKCGNPLCSKPFAPQLASNRYRMHAGELQPVEALEGDCYCSKPCSSFVAQLAVQLVNPMERIKPSALHKALARPSHGGGARQQGVGAQGGGVTTMKAVIEERPAYQLIHEAESAGRRLDEAAAAVSGDSTAAAAVEGYVPRHTPDTQPRQQPQAASQQPQPQQQQQQQQQQQRGSEGAAGLLNGADDEVLQLSPVLRPAAPTQPAAAQEAPAAAAAAAGPGSSVQPAAGAADATGTQSSGDDLQQYLKDFRELQGQKLQQLQQQQQQVHPSSVSHQSAAAPQAQQQQEAAETQEATAGGQGQMKQRRVRFAPDVAFTCPAEPPEPDQQQQQPVLTFTLHGDSAGQSAADSDRQGGSSGSSSSGGLMGELQLTTVDELEPDLQAAAAADGGKGEQQQQQEVPEAWKLFLPPALGGVGVTIKQVVIEGPQQAAKPAAAAAAAAAARARSKLPLQQQQQGAAPAAAHGAPVRSSAASRGANAAAAAAGPAADARNLTRVAAATPAAPAAAASAAAAGAAKAGKARKFSPLVRPRRSVVVLDEVPGLTLTPRGAQHHSATKAPPPPAAAAAAAQAGGNSNAGVEPAAAAAAGPDNIAAAPSVQQAAAGSKDSSSSRGQVVHIGPLKDRGSSHQGSSNSSSTALPADDSEEEGEDSFSEASSQEEWYHEREGGANKSSGSSSSRRNPRQQQQQNSSSRAAAVDGDEWDSGSELGADAASDVGGSLGAEEEGSDEEGGALGLGAEGLTVQGAKQALDSLLPFFDTRGITVSLSEFGLIWNQLHAWISPATLAYVGDRHAAAGAAAAAAAAAAAGGGGTGSDSSSSSVSYGISGVSASNTGAAAAADEAGAAAPQQQQQQQPSCLAVVQQRIALANLLTAALPPVVQQLNIVVPEAQLCKHLTALVRSFYMPGPLPALQARHWQLLVTLMLAALAAWQLPVLRPVFKREQQGVSGSGGSALSVLLQQLGSDVDRFFALMDLFGLS